MNDNIILLAQEQIEMQIDKVNRIMDKRESSGLHFNEFLTEEKARLYGMLQIYWLIGGKGFKQFKR